MKTSLIVFVVVTMLQFPAGKTYVLVGRNQSTGSPEPNEPGEEGK